MPRPFPRAAADLPARYAQRATSPDFRTGCSLVIDGVPEQVSAARAFVRQVLGGRHPGTDRVILLTSELVTNSVNHSNSRLAGGTVTVRLQVGADRIVVEVIDDGGATVPTLQGGDSLAETGRGLRLVNAFSLAWGYHRSAGCAVTWFGCAPEPLL